LTARGAILLIRFLISFGIGVAFSWIVYAVAGNNISGNAYILVAGIPALLVWVLLSVTAPVAPR
jgi:hypothetical protein